MPAGKAAATAVASGVSKERLEAILVASVGKEEDWVVAELEVAMVVVASGLESAAEAVWAEGKAEAAMVEEEREEEEREVEREEERVEGEGSGAEGREEEEREEEREKVGRGGNAYM